MRSFRSFASVPEGGFARPTAVTIGKFDGVHLGHQQVLARLRQIAEREGLEPVVFTFTENPLARLRPEVCPPPLTSPEQRLELLEKAGIAATLMVDFTPELQALEPCEFVQKVLVETLQARHLLVGQDFRFGARGAGDVAVLRELGEKFGFTVSVIDDVLCDGAEAGFGNGSGGGPEMTGNGCEDNSCESAEKGVPERISSSRIRALIAAGNVEKAGKLLGRPVTVRGIVAHGAARGRDLGFPTANLAPGFDGRAPQEGVYAGIAQLGQQRYRAAISVGSNPTFTPEAPVQVEAYLLDFSGDIYGQTLELEFLHRLRGMEVFADVQALIEQMRLDVLEVRAILPLELLA